MQRIRISLWILLTILTLGACRKQVAWSDSASHKNGFVTVNGIRLNYPTAPVEVELRPIALTSYNNTGPAYPFTC